MKSVLITQTYSDPAHEVYLNTLSAKLLEDVAIQGKYHGQQDMPTTEQEYRARVHYKIETTVQEALDYTRSVFQPISGMVVANHITKNAKQRSARLDAELQELEPALEKAEKTREALQPNPKRQWEIRLLMGALCLVSLAEGVFAYEALRQGGFTTWSAILPAVGIAVSIYFFTHATARQIREGKRGWKRILWITGGIAFVTAALFAVSSLRADGVNGQISLNPAEVLEVGGKTLSRWLLFAVSYFIYLAALVATVMHGRTDAEKEAGQEFSQVEVHAQKLRGQVAATRQERDHIQQQAAEQAAGALATFEYATACEERLIVLAKKAQVIYCEKNLQYRSDGLTPSFFVSPLPFTFRRFFDNINIPNNEN